MNALILAAATLAPQQYVSESPGLSPLGAAIIRRRYSVDMGADLDIQIRPPTVREFRNRPPRPSPYGAVPYGNGGYGGCRGGYAAPSSSGAYGAAPSAYMPYAVNGNGNGGVSYAYGNGNGAGYAPPAYYGGNGNGYAPRTAYAAPPATFERRQRLPGPDGY